MHRSLPSFSWSWTTSSVSSSYALFIQIDHLLFKLLMLLSFMLFYGQMYMFVLVNVVDHSSPSSSMLVNAEHRAGSYRRQQIQALYKEPCLSQNECRFDNTQCNLTTKKCQCKSDYVQVDSFVNRSYITHLAMTCLPIAQLDDRCISDLQCIVDYSECKLTTEVVAGANRTVHMCKCSPGHELKDDQATVILDGHSYRVRPVCDPERANSQSWIFVIIFITMLVILILICTFALIIRYQRLRQPYNQSTITSLTQQGMNSHPMGHHPMGSSSPPPMGSAEAEFQNDFIQVFPMHHLEPMPDKNAHAFIIK